jgi:hypothetical protein
MSGSVSMVDGHIDPDTKRRIDEATIVEALEHCIKGDCSGCPNLATEYCSTPENFQKEVLDLINRQQAEIERLNSDLRIWKDIAHRETEYVETAKFETIKNYLETCEKAATSNAAKVAKAKLLEMVGEDK